MEIKKTKKVVKEVLETTEHYYTCDKCGAKIETNSYDAFEFDFELREGRCYPEGGGGAKYLLDLCKNCAPKAVELLRENGYNVREEDWDY